MWRLEYSADLITINVELQTRGQLVTARMELELLRINWRSR